MIRIRLVARGLLGTLDIESGLSQRLQLLQAFAPRGCDYSQLPVLNRWLGL